MTTEFNTLIQSEKPILVDFFAAWCGPCQALMPILKQVKDQLGDQIKIVKIDESTSWWYGKSNLYNWACGCV